MLCTHPFEGYKASNDPRTLFRYEICGCVFSPFGQMAELKLPSGYLSMSENVE